jgi:hypothetical protein
MGHDLSLGHGFFSHSLPPIRWNLKLDCGRILERHVGSKWKIRELLFGVTYISQFYRIPKQENFQIVNLLEWGSLTGRRLEDAGNANK